MCFHVGFHSKEVSLLLAQENCVSPNSIRVTWLGNLKDCIFCNVCRAIYLLAGALLLQALFLWFNHSMHDNVHNGHIDQCPTAKGLFGWGRFLDFGATLFFVMSLMLRTNAQLEYLVEDELMTGGLPEWLSHVHRGLTSLTSVETVPMFSVFSSQSIFVGFSCYTSDSGICLNFLFKGIFCQNLRWEGCQV